MVAADTSRDITKMSGKGNLTHESRLKDHLRSQLCASSPELYSTISKETIACVESTTGT